MRTKVRFTCIIFFAKCGEFRPLDISVHIQMVMLLYVWIYKLGLFNILPVKRKMHAYEVRCSHIATMLDTLGSSMASRNLILVNCFDKGAKPSAGWSKFDLLPVSGIFESAWKCVFCEKKSPMIQWQDKQNVTLLW